MTTKKTTITSTRRWDSIRVLLGFKNRYDFALWAFFCGILTLFGLVRARSIYPSILATHIGPGEMYWMSQQPYKFGMILHLATIIPAALLCVTQFVPKIRAKAMLVHRTLGYIIFGLVSVSIIGALIIMPRSFGGDLSVVSGVSTLAVMVYGAMFMAWWNIRHLQIDQHRKWTIRAMAWMSIIITERIIIFASILVIPVIGGYSSLWTCDEALVLAGNFTVLHAEFPQCQHLGPGTLIGVPAGFDSVLHIGSTLRSMFGASMWMALALHVVAVEIYLTLTSAESERLRIASYHKQRAAGMAHPGSAGITNDRWGDAKMWSPPSKVVD